MTGLKSLGLGVAALALLGLHGAHAADEKLVVTGHAVHQKVLTDGPAGNVIADWEAKSGAEVEFLTFGVSEAQERAFREASLAEGGVDVSFILGRFGGPQIASLFTDLGELQAKDPIEDFDEISPGMRGAHTHGGKLIGIPFRHATHGLLYNAQILEERGVTPPATFDEVVEKARELTFTRDDGTKVHGMVLSMDDPSSIIDWIRAFGGEFVTSDYEVAIDQPEAVKAVAVLGELAQEGVFPPNMSSFATEDVITFMQQGRAAMTNAPFGRYKNFNDPDESKYPGAFEVEAIPMAEGAGPGPHPSKTSVWAMTIPANAPHPELAWDFIKFVSSKENTVRAAVNGNGPVRLSAYEDPRVQELVPYAADEAAALSNARIIVPGSENSAKAMDILMEEVEAVMIGIKEPEAAMADVKARVEPLLPNGG